MMDNLPKFRPVIVKLAALNLNGGLTHISGRDRVLGFGGVGGGVRGLWFRVPLKRPFYGYYMVSKRAPLRVVGPRPFFFSGYSYGPF